MNEDKEYQSLHYLEQHFTDVIEFYKESHIEGDYTPICVVESQDHELESLEFSLEKKTHTRDVDDVISEFKSRIQQLKQQKKIISAVIIYHCNRKDPDFKPAREIEDADAFLLSLFYHEYYSYLLPYQDKEEEVLYQDIMLISSD